MSSDNQWTALGPAAIGFQTDSTSITAGAFISGTECGATLVGQATSSSAPVFGAQARALIPDVNIDNAHIPQAPGLLAFGEGCGVMAMSGLVIRRNGGQVDAANIPSFADYGVVGVAANGPGVLGVGDQSSQAPEVLDTFLGPLFDRASTGVMGASGSGPGVTGISDTQPGVLGVSDGIGVAGISPIARWPIGFGNERGIAVLGASSDLGVVGLSFANFVDTYKQLNMANETKGVGVLGISDSAGVMGIGYNDRGGVFQSLPTENQLTAQARLVPHLVPRSWSPAELPTAGKIGDLLAIETALPVPKGDVPKTSCSLYLCTQGSTAISNAKWSEVMLNPV
jgi:hypothetical protein